MTVLPLSVEVAHKWYALRKEERVLIRSNWDGADVMVRADPDAALMDLISRRKSLKMPAQIPVLCRIPTLTEQDPQDTDMCVLQARDAKEGAVQMDPDHFLAKVFDSETADASPRQCSPSSDGRWSECDPKNLGDMRQRIQVVQASEPSRVKLEDARPEVCLFC